MVVAEQDRATSHSPGSDGDRRAALNDRLGRLVAAGRAAREELGRHGVEGPRRQLLEQQVATGADARRQLIEANLGLVHYLARRYRHRGDPADIAQDGVVGLVRAVDRFDPDTGVRFSTYAEPAIRGAIVRGLAQTAGVVRLPDSARSQVLGLAQAQSELAASLGRQPTVAEVSGHAGVAPDAAVRLLALASPPARLDVPAEQGGPADGALADRSTPPPEDQVAAAELSAAVAGGLGRLGDLDRELIRRRYGLGGTGGEPLHRTAAALGISAAAARRHERRVLAVLAVHLAVHLVGGHAGPPVGDAEIPAGCAGSSDEPGRPTPF